MMTDYEKRYSRVLTAEKNMDAAIVEYINGSEVIKAFNQSAASYGKYAAAVKENESAKATWFRQTNSFYVAGISIMQMCIRDSLEGMDGILRGPCLVRTPCYEKYPRICTFYREHSLLFSVFILICIIIRRPHSHYLMSVSYTHLFPLIKVPVWRESQYH